MGIGSKLMMQAINLAKSLNKKFIWLGVWKDNLNALSFYQKVGFISMESILLRLVMTIRLTTL
ncbi:GNAT family N-acetyltransferase [Lentilactobacillus laojiaonis]|uniref:GNAT family N-acetyltransferase n=1 Tax=Lentilactobacillus laojiaonis TaxID=2883998 RepID=UPI003D30F717